MMTRAFGRRFGGLVAIVLGGVLCACSSTKPSAAMQDAVPGAPRTTVEPAWSESVEGLQGRLRLKPLRVLNGTMILRPYLELHNTTDVATPISFAFSSRIMKAGVVDGGGKRPFEEPTFGTYSGMGPPEVTVIIPTDGTISFSIGGYGAGVPRDHAVHIDLGTGCIVDVPTRDKPCWIEMTLEIPETAAKSDGLLTPWHGKLVLPRAAIPLAPEPLDPATAGATIDALGRAMLKNDGQSAEDAAAALSLINDPRVIPWYIAAVKTRSAALKCEALDRLGGFVTAEAIEGIRIGMATGFGDLDDGTRDSDVRHAAAGALARNKHPEAKRLLFTMAGDKFFGVRLAVLQAFGEDPSPAAEKLVASMAVDVDEMVSREAQRYMELRRKRSAATHAGWVTQGAASRPAGGAAGRMAAPPSSP